MKVAIFIAIVVACYGSSHAAIPGVPYGFPRPLPLPLPQPYGFTHLLGLPAVATPYVHQLGVSVATPYVHPVFGGPVYGVAPVTKATQANNRDPSPQYSYAYVIRDTLTGDTKSKQETRSGNTVHGSYYVMEADGTRRTVQYAADPQNGFNAKIHREPLGGVVKAVFSVGPVAPVSPITPFAHFGHVTPKGDPVAPLGPVVHFTRFGHVTPGGNPVAHFTRFSHGGAPGGDPVATVSSVTSDAPLVPVGQVTLGSNPVTSVAHFTRFSHGGAPGGDPVATVSSVTSDAPLVPVGQVTLGSNPVTSVAHFTRFSHGSPGGDPVATVGSVTSDAPLVPVGHVTSGGDPVAPVGSVSPIPHFDPVSHVNAATAVNPILH